MPFGTLASTGQSMPLFSPPYPHAKAGTVARGNFSDMTVVAILYRVKASQISHLVPDMLELEEEPLMSSLFVQYGMSSVGAYTEFCQQVEVTYQGEKFDYNIILILDNDAAIYAGRELHGFPKVHGRTDIQTVTGGGVVLGGAERPVGRKVIEFEFIPQHMVSSGLPMPNKWMLNLRSMPSPIIGEPPSIHELVPVFMDKTFSDVWLGKGQVSFPRNSTMDPWVNFDVLRYEGSFFARNVAASFRLRDKNFKI
ncbi:hypothetical protein F4779DRAFT_611202 [Xylariaceae sp. FL0662B]|nr:hypothetical protein F4779DRAFT_611202 [Xylariaceae sp. FL0662B]